MPSGDIPAAIAADSPPEDPPGVRSRFHGLLVRPVTRLSVSVHAENSGIVGLREDDAAGSLEARHRSGVRVGDAAGEHPGASSGEDSRRVDRILHGHRNAVQGAEFGAACHSRIGGVGGAQRIVGKQGDDGVDLRITSAMRSRCACTTSRDDTCLVAIRSARRSRPDSARVPCRRWSLRFGQRGGHEECPLLGPSSDGRVDGSPGV